MKIDRELIEQIGSLARLKLEEDEKERLKDQLTRILEHVETLGELDLEGVTPLTHPLDLKNVSRSDEVREGLAPGEAMKNAPQREGNFFRVPRVIEED